MIVARLIADVGRRVKTFGGALAVAAIAPFIVSHVVVMAARHIGMPDRLILDLAHGVVVLAYLSAAVRVAQGDGEGSERFGFGVPSLSWPGSKVVFEVGAAVVALGLPAALVLHPLVQWAEGLQASSPTGLYFPVTMVPEFIMTTLIALVLAAGLATLDEEPGKSAP